MTPRLNKSVLIENLNKSYASFDDSEDEGYEVQERPRSAIRYKKGSSGIEAHPDFLEDFNSRLVKLEERL
jgi:hypothetical protein